MWLKGHCTCVYCMWSRAGLLQARSFTVWESVVDSVIFLPLSLPTSAIFLMWLTTMEHRDFPFVFRESEKVNNLCVLWFITCSGFVLHNSIKKIDSSSLILWVHRDAIRTWLEFSPLNEIKTFSLLSFVVIFILIILASVKNKLFFI